jgi:phosphoribosylamine--glycine ligase
MVYGSGGRDHCLADKYADSQNVDKVYFVPGNPGVHFTIKGQRGLIEPVSFQGDNEFMEVAKFCIEKKVDLVDIGSENPLSNGLVNMLRNHAIPAVGPLQEYTMIESDRAFTNLLLSTNGIGKPEYRVFSDPDRAQDYVRNIGYQVVVKANGLAAGKGAIVCDDVDDALQAIEEIMVKKVFGRSGDRVVIEERKYGTELSFYVYLDGRHILPLKMLCQDYKTAFDPEDTESIKNFGGNLNTGGTGCYCPHKLLSANLVNRIIKEIVNPFVDTVYNKLGWAYKGVLYFGLNLDPDNNLEVFEINVRHGDPEFEVLARKLSTDMYALGRAVHEGRLDTVRQVWNQQSYVDVIAMEGRSKASRGWNKGYPKRYGKGHKIAGLDDLERGVAIYFAGVDTDDEKGLVTYGGRVLHVVAGDKTLPKARAKAYRNIARLAFVDHKNGDNNCMRYRETIAL